MYIEYTVQADAQTKADTIHQWMQDNVPAYKASVLAGQTLRWDIAKQPTDVFGNILSTNWQVTIKTKVNGALSSAEKLAVK